MVWEKVEAMSLAGDLQAIHAAMLRPLRNAKAANAASARIRQLAAGAAGRALAPVHERATANARRLSRPRAHESGQLKCESTSRTRE